MLVPIDASVVWKRLTTVVVVFATQSLLYDE